MGISLFLGGSKCLPKWFGALRKHIALQNGKKGPKKSAPECPVECGTGGQILFGQCPNLGGVNPKGSSLNADMLQIAILILMNLYFYMCCFKYDVGWMDYWSCPDTKQVCPVPRALNLGIPSNFPTFLFPKKISQILGTLDNVPHFSGR